MHPSSQRTPNGPTHLRTNSAAASTTSARAPLSTAGYREELIANRYNLTHPKDVYPLDPSPNGNLPPTPVPQFASPQQTVQNQQHKYPDFQPWKASPRDETLAVTHLQQGYSEPPFVTNEFVSARNIMHNLLQSRNALPDLSSNFLTVIQVRSANNTVPPSSFKTPPRVTLSDQKREAWLKDLANDSVPLRKLSRTIPHGIRNKNLIEHCILKSIPINRAMWLVRCVSANELKSLRRKGSTNSMSGSASNSSVESNWVSEWTNQVVEYLEKLSLDYLRFESFVKAKESWKFKIQYFLRFLSNLYLEKLIDKDIFKNWLLNFFRNCQNFEIPLVLTTIKIFWAEILKTDYLVKEFTEILLLKYHKVSNLKNLLDLKDSNLVINDMKLNEQIKGKLLNNFKSLITQSFYQSIDNFIIPNNWNLLKNSLKAILNLEDPDIKKKFELITYRNESLMINYSINNNESSANDLVHLLDSIAASVKFKEIEFSSILNLIFSDQELLSSNHEEWRNNLYNFIKWSITKYRTENYRIYLVAETLKKVKSTVKPSSSIQFKDIESEIMNIIFNLHSNSLEDINTTQLYHLLNELGNIKLFKTSTYMRKIISSGLVYLSNNDAEKQYHLSILSNLKFENNNQSVMILKKLSNSDGIFADLEEKFKSFLELLENRPYEALASYHDCDDLEIGLKLKISYKYLMKLKSNPLHSLDFPTLQNIVMNFIKLNDFKNLNVFIQFALSNEAQVMTLKHLHLISELLIDFDKLFLVLVGDLEKFVTLFINSYKTCSVNNDNGVSLTKFWIQLKNYGLYSESSILEELEILKTVKIPPNIELVNHDLVESQIGLSIDDFNDHNKYHNNFQILIRSIFSNLSNNNQIDSSLNLLKLLQQIHETEFNKILFIFIKKKFSAYSNEIFNYKPLYDLISYDLLSIKTILDFFMNFGDNSMYYQFIMELLFKNHDPAQYSHSLRLNLVRERLKQDHPELLINIIKISFNSSKSSNMKNPIENSDEILMDLMHDNDEKLRINSQYKTQCLSLFLNTLVHHRDVILNFLKDEKNSEFKAWIVEVLNNDFIPESIEDIAKAGDLEVNAMEVDTTQSEMEVPETLMAQSDELTKEANKANDESNVKKLITNLKHFDRFNLPIFQLLFRLILNGTNDQSINYNQMLLNFVNNENIKGDFKLFGSLFELLDDELKINFIHFLESLFLHSKHFPVVRINDEVEIQQSVISEIIIRLSNGVLNIPLPDELVFSLDISLDSLLKLASQPHDKLNVQLLLESLQLFLKIVIIHKPFIIGVIIERNSIKESFLNNLVSLLSTKFLSQNLQLKNLLYDLILSIKSTLNQPGSNVKIPPSLMNLPAISSNEASNPGDKSPSSFSSTSSDVSICPPSNHSKTANRFNNLQDQNTLSHLFLLHKSTMSYSDLNVKPFDMLENSNPVGYINDTALSLQLFDASIERKNPT